MSQRVAVVGATGAVGREFLEVLEGRDFPVGDLRLLASRRSAGLRLPFRGEEVPVGELGPESLRGVDIAFFSAGSAISREYGRSAAGRDTIVIDNSSAFRMDDDVPLVVPEVNGERARDHRGIIANPNCSTILFVVAVAPIHALGRIRRAIVCTYQAVSGAGAGGMDALEWEAANPGQRAKGSVFPHPIAGNVIPEIGGFDDAGDSEEEVKLERETRKILEDPSIRIASTCVRIPVARAHSEAIHLEMERPLSPEDVRSALAGAPGVEVVDDLSTHTYPTPLMASHREEVLVGRIRRDPALAHGLACFISGDQLLKGAALNAVQIGELLL